MIDSERLFHLSFFLCECVCRHITMHYMHSYSKYVWCKTAKRTQLHIGGMFSNAYLIVRTDGGAGGRLGSATGQHDGGFCVWGKAPPPLSEIDRLLVRFAAEHHSKSVALGLCWDALFVWYVHYMWTQNTHISSNCIELARLTRRRTQHTQYNKTKPTTWHTNTCSSIGVSPPHLRSLIHSTHQTAVCCCFSDAPKLFRSLSLFLSFSRTPSHLFTQL